jgi:threonine aldolase
MIVPRHFASDNNAGVHPEVLRALASVNEGHAAAYGADEITARFDAVIEATFGSGALGFALFGGTAANVLPLRHLTREHEGIVCAATAHIHVDECGAVEATAGRKLLPQPSVNGKLTPEVVQRVLVDRGDLHRVQPRVLSLSQATEYGTVYSVDELRALCELAHAEGMLVHMDGARIANAAVALGSDLRAVTRDVGVDVLSLGGTKNGLMGADAVVFFDERLAAGFEFVRKQMMQLGSKMRFLAIQFVALLENDLWRRGALHANAMAQLLHSEVQDIPGVTITQPVQTNAVFAVLSQQAIERLQQTWRFGIWNEALREVRWMTAFDTTEDDVRAFARHIAAATR